jgi:amino acid permease
MDKPDHGSTLAEPLTNAVLVDNDGNKLITSTGATGVQGEERVRTGTFSGSVVNLLNNAIGSGVLVFPFAYGQAGVFFGLIAGTFFAGILGYTFHICGRTQLATNGRTYQSMIRAILGRKGERFALWVQVFFICGACTGYLDIVADQIQPALQQSLGDHSMFAQRWFIVVMAAIFFCAPLMCIRNIQLLSPMSTFSLIAIFYTMCVLIAHTASQLKTHTMPPFVMGEPKAHEISAIRYSSDIVKSIPVFAFSFMLHPSYCLVLDEMKERSLKAMDKAVLLSLTGCGILYAIFGIVGYIYCAVSTTYTDSNDGSSIPPGDILKALPKTAVDVTIARFSIAISVISSYVGLHFGVRTVFQDLLLKEGQQFTKSQFYTEIALFLSVTSLLAIAIPDVATVIDFTAGSTIIALQFCFPGAMVIALARLALAGEGSSEHAKSGPIGWTMLAFGVVMGMTSVAVTAVGAAKGSR